MDQVCIYRRGAGADEPIMRTLPSTPPILNSRPLTETETLQNELIEAVHEIYDRTDLSEVELNRDLHLKYLQKGFTNGFPSAYVSLDASRPWLVYWALHAIDLLGGPLPEGDLLDRSIETLKSFQAVGEGGFCGGDHEFTGHLAHLAPTYASVLSIAILATPLAYSLIDIPALRSFLKRLKTVDGAFRMHAIDGEVDVRAVYCAVVAGKLTGCWDEELEEGVVEWIGKCQSWEGGFGGVPGAEAHGGYTFCAVAALSLLDKLTEKEYPCGHSVNLENLIFWLTSQQIQQIGGFRGRTHKLVDGCYSFWQAGAFACLGMGKLVDSLALQQYVLVACQEGNCRGGLRDKPGKSPDFYHTCYCLSGLSLAQHQIADPEFILGGAGNILRAVDPKFNLVKGKAEEMISYFSNKYL